MYIKYKLHSVIITSIVICFLPPVFADTVHRLIRITMNLRFEIINYYLHKERLKI